MIADVATTGLRSYRIVLAAIFLSSLAVGWLILPGENERVAMLERDGHSHEALSILEKLFSSGDRRYNTLMQMQQLYEQEGNIPKARQFLESMAAERPRDPVLRRRLARFYRDTHDQAAYIAALNSQISLRYSEQACRELVSVLRLKGAFNEEQSALQTCRQKGYRRPEDLSRLASLLNAAGDAGQAATILRSIDDLRRLTEAADRYQLLSLLLDLDQPKEAERRCLRWIKASKDDALAVSLIEILARSKYPDSAIEVAKDAGEPGDSISLTVAERLIEQSQLNPARLYLRGWLDKTQSKDQTTLIRFIDAARSVADPQTAFAAVKKFGFDALPAEMRLRLSDDLEKGGFAAEAQQLAASVPATPAAPLPSGIYPADDQEPPSPVVLPSEVGPVTVEAAPNGGGRHARTLARDPLDVWRRSLVSKMTEDAARRLQASQFGPPVPPGLERAGSLKLFKKTSRVLLRAKRNRLLKSRRPQHREPAKGAKH